MTVLDPSKPYEVAHGYTTWDVMDIARYSVSRSRPGRIASFEEYLEIAVTAIEDRLLSAVEKPTQTDLLRAAGRGIYRFRHEWEQQHGWDHRTMNFRPGFERYWTWHPPQPEDAVVDKLAVHQVWPTLTPAMQQAVSALVMADGDQVYAAAMLGINLSAYKMRLRAARQRFQQWWYEPETPPSRPIWRRANSSDHMRLNGLKAGCLRWHEAGCECWREANEDGTCSVDGCDKPRRKGGLCYGHSKEQCSIDGCDRPSRKRGLCYGHHKEQWLATQRPVEGT